MRAVGAQGPGGRAASTREAAGELPEASRCAAGTRAEQGRGRGTGGRPPLRAALCSVRPVAGLSLCVRLSSFTRDVFPGGQRAGGRRRGLAGSRARTCGLGSGHCPSGRRPRAARTGGSRCRGSRRRSRNPLCPRKAGVRWGVVAAPARVLWATAPAARCSRVCPLAPPCPRGAAARRAPRPPAPHGGLRPPLGGTTSSGWKHGDRHLPRRSSLPGPFPPDVLAHGSGSFSDYARPPARLSLSVTLLVVQLGSRRAAERGTPPASAGSAWHPPRAGRRSPEDDLTLRGSGGSPGTATSPLALGLECAGHVTTSTRLLSDG